MITTKTRLLHLLLVAVLILLNSCLQKVKFTADFNKINNRIWMEEELLPVPMVGWKIHDGRIECTSKMDNKRVN